MGLNVADQVKAKGNNGGDVGGVALKPLSPFCRLGDAREHYMKRVRRRVYTCGMQMTGKGEKGEKRKT